MLDLIDAWHIVPPLTMEGQLWLSAKHCEAGMFDTLEVFLKHDPGCDRSARIAALSKAIAPRFGVVAMEMVHDLETEVTRQIVRFCSEVEVFATADEFEHTIRGMLVAKPIAESFSWRRAGVLRIGQPYLTCI